MRGAKGVLINITGGVDMTLFEVDSAANRIRKEVGDPHANIIFGSTFNPELNGTIRVSVVATGIDTDQTMNFNKSYANTDEPMVQNSTPSSIDNVESLVEISEEIPNYTQYSTENDITSSEIQAINLGIQVSPTNIHNQSSTSDNKSLFSRMWHSLKPLPTEPSEEQTKVTTHAIQSNEVEVDIHDIPAFLRKQK